MKLKLLAVGLLAIGGGVVASAAPAVAYPYCGRFPSAPSFSGVEISGSVVIDCSRSVPTATAYARIKEDRNNLPDVVHDTESLTFYADRVVAVNTSTCQDDDDIYIEGQINNEAATGGTRKEMDC